MYGKITEGIIYPATKMGIFTLIILSTADIMRAVKKHKQITITNRFLQLNIFSLCDELLKCWIWFGTMTLWFLYFFHEIKTNADRDETKQMIVGNIIDLQMLK